jgi:hypothetical protein
LGVVDGPRQDKLDRRLLGLRQVSHESNHFLIRGTGYRANDTPDHSLIFEPIQSVLNG